MLFTLTFIQDTTEYKERSTKTNNEKKKKINNQMNYTQSTTDANGEKQRRKKVKKKKKRIKITKIPKENHYTCGYHEQM